jgi:DNA-binding response OmpR family regulator
MATGRACILIAEDERDIRDVLGDLLEDDGHDVALARDGTEALILAHRRRPDLILLDVRMPRLDAEAFCRTYRERGGSAPIVLITAADPDRVAAAVKSCGAADSILKPFDISIVLDTIRRHLPSDPGAGPGRA